MSVKHLTVISLTVASAVLAPASHAYQENPNNQSMHRPDNAYWQAPNWQGFNSPPNYRSPPPPQMRPAHNNQPPPNYRPPQSNYNPQMQRPAPNAYRGNPPPQQYGSYRGPSYGPDNGASAYNMPGYHRYRNNGWNNNKFWGRSGPSTWMNPNKNNMERGWDDMMNAPSRMGEMPGGWTAPEVSMPNPIDMGDQIQDNVKDLPEQMRNMDVGNEVD